MKSIPLDEKHLGLVEMTSGLVNASFSLPEWQAVKMIFFAPCICHCEMLLLVCKDRGIKIKQANEYDFLLLLLLFTKGKNKRKNS